MKTISIEIYRSGTFKARIYNAEFLSVTIDPHDRGFMVYFLLHNCDDFQARPLLFKTYEQAKEFYEQVQASLSGKHSLIIRYEESGYSYGKV